MTSNTERRLTGFGPRDLLAGLLVNDLHRQPDLAAVVAAEQLHPDLVAFLDHLVDGLGPAFGKLRDVHQAVAGAEEIHEGAELHDLDDLALVDLADLGLGGDAFDAVDRRADLLGVGRGDLDRAVVGDVDLGARFRHDLADYRAARADHLADLVDRNSDRLDARRVFAELRPRRVQRLVHL